VAASGNGNLTLLPAGLPQPNTSVLNFSGGQTRANNTLLMLSSTPERALTV
jgi:hypothetical protein